MRVINILDYLNLLPIRIENNCNTWTFLYTSKHKVRSIALRFARREGWNIKIITPFRPSNVKLIWTLHCFELPVENGRRIWLDGFFDSIPSGWQHCICSKFLASMQSGWLIEIQILSKLQHKRFNFIDIRLVLLHTL